MNARESELESMWRFTKTTTPVGPLLLVGKLASSGRLELTGLYFDGAAHASAKIPDGAVENPAVFEPVIAQLEDYFSGARTTFELPLAPRGTEFQREVWRALAAIPYGTTTTYAQIARTIGRPRAVRAVGAANGKNPISIVVPCHRVIGQDGTLTGYAGGIANKKTLLELESRTIRTT